MCSHPPRLTNLVNPPPLKLVIDNIPAPLDGEDVPDFAAMRDRLRPKFALAGALKSRSERALLEALAAARELLRAAGEHPGDFRRIARDDNIKSGRLEVAVLRMLFEGEVKPGTTASRYADALMWMGQYPHLDDETIVGNARKLGGSGAIAELWRNRHGSGTPPSEPELLIEEVDARLEQHEPIDMKPLFGMSNEDRFDLMLIRRRPGCYPEMYPIDADDKTIRRLLPKLV